MTLVPPTGDFLCPTKSLKITGQGDDTGELAGENSTCQTILFVSFGQGKGVKKGPYFRSLQGGSRVFSTYAVLAGPPRGHALSLAGASRTSLQSC